MPINWKTYKLGDLISTITDYHANGAYKKLKENVTLLDKEDYAAMIRSTNFEKNDFKDLKYIDRHAYDFLRKSKVFPGDVLMNKIANAGSVYFMPDLNIPVSLGMNLFLIRFREDIANPYFLYKYLKANERYVKSYSAGSVTKTITKDAVKNLDIVLPPLQEQRAIASILSALDDKIELNLQMNKTLEDMAMELYKHWFVDFGPFQNGEFVDSELGKIPKGWEVKSIGDVTTLKYGKALKKTDRISGDYPVYGSSGIVGTNVKHLIDGPSLIIGRKGNVGSIFWEEKQSFPIDTVYYVNDLNRDELRYLFFKIVNTDFKNTNSDSVIPGLNRDLAHNEKLVWPIEEVLTEFMGTVQSLYALNTSNKIDTNTLTNLRDTLLPRLISGEVRVKDIEKTVAEVL